MTKSIEQHWSDAHEAFVKLKQCVPVSQTNLPADIRGKGGIYVFFDMSGTALYVGRSRNIYKRIRHHSRQSAKDGPLAWLLVCDETGWKAKYTSKDSRKTFSATPQFCDAFERAKNRIRQMKVAYVVEEDDTTQCLLEIIAAVEFKAKHNSFRTT